MPDHYKITYKRTPKTTTTMLMVRFPGHDLWYKVREEIATGKKWYQPRCPCGYQSENWYPSRGQRIERIFVSEHLSKTINQGTLGGPEASPPSSNDHPRKWIGISDISNT